ncbi:hypothetical protein KIN20_010023 [Parelaphostrongylus tenuis]|uniref:Uncharacterized protein n=1 Tax=Parelaphostrongylus tenuis TaxID=148309 RepID=A0AAD5MBY8_PARTN|nr:hypothetical protein KIN20_010023 [Parelaphostrongylus tenuis]
MAARVCGQHQPSASVDDNESEITEWALPYRHVGNRPPPRTTVARATTEWKLCGLSPPLQTNRPNIRASSYSSIRLNRRREPNKVIAVVQWLTDMSSTTFGAEL